MELLIVIVVIAILAAITIVSYRGITTNAQVAALKSTLQQAASKLEIYRIDNGSYPPDQVTMAGLVSFDSSTTLAYAVNNAATSPAYCLIAAQGALRLSVSSANRTPSDNACVSNLAFNPRCQASTAGWFATNNGGTYSTSWFRRVAQTETPSSDRPLRPHPLLPLHTTRTGRVLLE